MDPIKIYFAVASRVWYILLNILFINIIITITLYFRQNVYY